MGTILTLLGVFIVVWLVLSVLMALEEKREQAKQDELDKHTYIYSGRPDSKYKTFK
jgi:hypothetical protein